jgi:hypothetical protein
MFSKYKMLELFIIAFIFGIIFIIMLVINIAMMFTCVPLINATTNLIEDTLLPEGEEVLKDIGMELNVQINDGIDDMFNVLDSMLSTVLNPSKW